MILQDQQRALILAAQPLVIDGKVLYRDLRGLRSVDLESGHTLWEGVEGISPERILGGLPSQQVDPQDAWRLPMNPFQNLGDHQGMSAEYNPADQSLVSRWHVRPDQQRWKTAIRDRRSRNSVTETTRTALGLGRRRRPSGCWHSLENQPAGVVRPADRSDTVEHWWK